MVVSMVELLFGLSLGGLILLVGACILGSIYSALRAVGRERDCQREDMKQDFSVVAEVTVSKDGHDNLPYASQLSEQMQYGRRTVNWRDHQRAVS
jgi:hypothetical protein